MQRTLSDPRTTLVLLPKVQPSEGRQCSFGYVQLRYWPGGSVQEVGKSPSVDSRAGARGLSCQDTMELEVVHTDGSLRTSCSKYPGPCTCATLCGQTMSSQKGIRQVIRE